MPNYFNKNITDEKIICHNNLTKIEKGVDNIDACKNLNGNLTKNSTWLYLQRLQYLCKYKYIEL